MKRTLIQASYRGTVAEWDDLANRLDANGETRTATAIRNALNKTRAHSDGFGFYTIRDLDTRRPGFSVQLRFRGGTIATIDGLIDG